MNFMTNFWFMFPPLMAGSVRIALMRMRGSFECSSPAGVP